MEQLLRVRDRMSVISQDGQREALTWTPLLAFIAIALGFLGIGVHQLGLAPVPYGLSLAIAGAGGLVLVNRDRTAAALNRLTISERAVVWFSILNLIVTNSVLFLSFHSEQRPTVVFFLLAMQAGVIAVQVLLAPCSAPQVRFLLRSQILLLSTGIILSRLLVYPEIGIDIWPQEFFAQKIVQSGQFPLPDTAYKGYPFWPALVGVISMFTGRPEQDVILATTLAFSSIALWLLLVGLQRTFGYRQSLLAGLILAVSGWFVYWASFAVPMIVTITLFGALVVLLFSRRNELQLEMTACLLVLLAAGAFYHPMSNVASGFMLLTAAVVFWFFAWRGAGENWQLSVVARRAAIGATIAMVVTLSVWMYLGQTFDNLARVVYQSIQQLEPLSFRGGYRSTLVYELDYVGFHLLLLLALARFLRWWVRPVRSPFEITLLAGSLVFLGVNYLAIITDAMFSLPHRWLVYASVLLSFPAALELWSIARGRAIGTALVIVLVMALAFTAVVNTGVSDDNPTYGADVAFRQGMTASETAAVEFLDLHLTTDTAVDYQVWNYFRVLKSLDLRPEGTLSHLIMYHEKGADAVCPDRPTTLPDAALLRRVYLNGRIVGWSPCSVEPSGLEELDETREFVQVYDSGEASLYRRVRDSDMLVKPEE
jgi:hypothetical protein